MVNLHHPPWSTRRHSHTRGSILCSWLARLKIVEQQGDQLEALLDLAHLGAAGYHV